MSEKLPNAFSLICSHVSILPNLELQNVGALLIIYGQLNRRD